MMAACQSSRDEYIRFARLMPARFSIILTAVSDTSTILPTAMFKCRGQTKPDGSHPHFGS